MGRGFPRGSGEVQVLADVELSLFGGEIVGLLGRSGSGKSTLLRIISGLIKPNSGEVVYRGQPVDGAAAGIAMVFQTFALFPWLTVLQNVEAGLEALFWTLMHVLDERSPLHGYDAGRAIEVDAQVFVTVEARDPTLSATVHDIRNYAAKDIRFGLRYTDPVTTEDGTPVLDLTRIGEMEPDVGDRREQGWTEREDTGK